MSQPGSTAMGVVDRALWVGWRAFERGASQSPKTTAVCSAACCVRARHSSAKPGSSLRFAACENLAASSEILPPENGLLSGSTAVSSLVSVFFSFFVFLRFNLALSRRNFPGN